MSPLTWQAPEFEYHEKTPLWYWVTVGIAVAFLAIAIWQHNFIFAILVVIGEILILAFGAHQPKVVSFSLGEEGLRLGDEPVHPLGTIDAVSLPGYSFEDFSTMVIHFRGKLRVPLHVTIPSEVLPSAREFWSRNNIPEIDHEHTLMESFERYIGF